MDENRVVTRSIELTWGGEQRVLPVLPMKPADDWRRLMTEKFDDTDDSDGQEKTVAGVLSESADQLVEALMAYDRSSVLGTREWIESNVTEEELADAFLEVWRRSFRLSRLTREMGMAVLGQPQPARSLNGRSLTGTSTQTN
jgi:hypothetical protein